MIRQFFVIKCSVTARSSSYSRICNLGYWQKNSRNFIDGLFWYYQKHDFKL